QTGIAGDAHAADPAVVVGLEQANGDARLHVLAVVSGAAAVALSVHDGDLAIDLVVVPLGVDPRTEVGRREVFVAIERDGALHTVVPERLFKVDPRRVQQTELVGEGTAGWR